VKTIGMVTVGQAPRLDWGEDLAAVLPASTCLVQAGALDGMTYGQITALEFAPDDNVLVTKMQDGTEVRVPEQQAKALISKRIKELEGTGIDIIYLACTWDFDITPGKAFIVCPKLIVAGVLAALTDGKTLGICVPDERQIPAAAERWCALAKRLVTVYSPAYKVDGESKTAAEKLVYEKVDFVLLDCMGYTKETGDFFREITGKPTLVPRLLTNRVLAELL
jgi:protein AroM